ncbi:MAG: 30S ribosome-binding factor RbfA [Phycisphaerales bacterium]|nr:30S ribosome-binding factor RbfA [Phycisphaerales bacterium]
MTISHRRDQLAQMLRESIQGVLSRGLSDPRLDGAMLTITEVDLSPDFANAAVRVSVIPPKAQKRAIAALVHAARHIRHEVSDRLDLRATPNFNFQLDISTKRQAGVFEALAKVREEREAAGIPAPESAPDPARVKADEATQHEGDIEDDDKQASPEKSS